MPARSPALLLVVLIASPAAGQTVAPLRSAPTPFATAPRATTLPLPAAAPRSASAGPVSAVFAPVGSVYNTPLVVSQFPAQRSHDQRYLQRPIRLPLEAILNAQGTTELIRRSLGERPAFASAPVVGSPANPFAAAATPPGPAPGGASPDVTAADGLTTGSPPAAPPSANPFGDEAADNNPFATPSAPAERNPFADPEDSDPFAL